MATCEEQESIEIVPDGTAIYRKLRVLPSADGGAVRSRVVCERRVRAAELLPERAESSCLPVGTRFTDTTGGVSVFVVEKEPGLRTVQWKIHDNWEGEPFSYIALCESGLHEQYGESLAAFEQRLRTQRTFTLAFPYLVQVFVFHDAALRSAACYYRAAPLASGMDELLGANLPNQNTDGSICLPRMVDGILQTSGMSFAERVAQIDKAFWGSAWNKDLYSWFLEAAQRIREVSSPWHWEVASRRDELFALRMPWVPLGQTVGGLTDRWCNRARNGSRNIYTDLVQRVLAAERDDGTRVADDRMPVSTSVFVATTGGVLTIGDRITIQPRFLQECPAGGTFAIEWFGRATRQGSRFVKLADVAYPAPIIQAHALVRGVTREVIPGASVSVGDATITSGTILRFRNLPLFPEAGTFARRVAGVRRDAAGVVHVECADHVGVDAFAIADREGLYDGVEVIGIPECTPDGFLRADSVTLRDGTTFAKGQQILRREAMGVVSVGHILAFLPIDVDQSVFCLGAWVAPGVRWPLETLNGTCADTIARLPDPPLSEVDRDGQTFRVGDTVRYGRQHVIVRTIGPVLTQSNERYVELEDVRWVPLRDCTPVQPIVVGPDGSWVECDGKRVSAQEQTYFDMQTQRLCVIARFVARDEADADAEVVCVDDAASSRRMPFMRDWCMVFACPVVVTSVRIGTHTLVRGDAVRLRRDVARQKMGTVFTIAYVVPATAQEPLTIVCTNGLSFPLSAENAEFFEHQMEDGTFDRLPGHHAAYPETRYKRPLERYGFQREFWSAGAVPLLQMGTVVGKNAAGDDITIGSRVRIPIEGTMRTAEQVRKLIATGHIFTVVHTHQNLVGTWCWLDAGEDVGGRAHPEYDPVLPEDSARDSGWWQRICYAALSRCVLVPQPTQEEGGTRT